MSERRPKRARRKRREKLYRDARRTARIWQLFGDAMRFAAAHAPPDGDVFNLLRYGGDAHGSVLDHFCRFHPDLDDEDRKHVAAFVLAFSSLFYVDRRTGLMLQLTDLVTGRSLEVVIADPTLAAGIKTDHYIGTLVVPTPDGWLLGGRIRPVLLEVPSQRVLQVARRIALQEADRVRFALPEITAAMLKDLDAAFRAHFEADHVVGATPKVLEAVSDFHRTWKPPQHQGYINAGQLETDLDLASTPRIGVTADPAWGTVIVGDLDQLLLAVRTHDAERVSRWLEDRAHPAAFRCAHRNHPDAFASIMEHLLGADWANTLDSVLVSQARPNVLPLPLAVASAPPEQGPGPADGIGLAEILAD